MLRNFLIALSLVLFSFVPASSRQITNGKVEVAASHGFVFFVMNVSGADFRVAAAGSNLVGTAFASCGVGLPDCTAGQVINLSAFSGQWDFSDVSGPLTIDGTQYFLVNEVLPKSPSLSGRGSLSFSGGSVMIPFSDARTTTLKSTFSMSGSLGGIARDLLFGVGLSLSGSGITTADLTLNDFGGKRTYVLHSLIYRFGFQASVDIKPGDDSNHINLSSRGKTPVAILSTADFDASTINPFTITVAGAPVTLKPNGTPMSSLEDINGDGLLDLVVHVSTAALQPDSDNDCLVEGTTFDGQYFFGFDTITVVP
jgi:hypothetical protein